VLVVDFTGVRYVDSGGIGALAFMHEHATCSTGSSGSSYGPNPTSSASW
jgi:anti-anti-sigma regulatory factor